MLLTDVFAVETAQWPGRTGVYPDKNLLKQWPQDGPELLWSTNGIGDGLSSVSVYKESVYATGKIDSLDYITAIDERGHQFRQIPYGLAALQSFTEMHCTPALEDNFAYMISGRGQVVCVHVKGARVVWSVDAFERFKGAFGLWEIAGSPLLVDDKVIYTPAGQQTTMIALDKNNGKVVWTTKSLDDSTWIDQNKQSWACLDWDTGELKYEQEWETKGSIISADGMLIIYEEKRGHVALLKADPDTFSVISFFRNREGKGPHWAHPVIDSGRLFIRHGDSLQAFRNSR